MKPSWQLLSLKKICFKLFVFKLRCPRYSFRTPRLSVCCSLRRCLQTESILAVTSARRQDYMLLNRFEICSMHVNISCECCKNISKIFYSRAITTNVPRMSERPHSDLCLRRSSSICPMSIRLFKLEYADFN